MLTDRQQLVLVNCGDRTALDSRIMKPSNNQLASLCGFLMLLLQVACASGGTQFLSHVTVNTPARSYSHGVGDPIPSISRRSYQQRQQRPVFRGRQSPLPSHGGGGYPRVRPTIPFNNEDRPRSISNLSPWQQNSFHEVSIPLLPPSPYKVDSADPESLWPEGLFLPPITPHTFTYRRSDAGQVVSEADTMDPYLLEGSEAIAAVQRARSHGLYYFHDIPHIESLLENQELRIQNHLEPHRLGSIRHTWPYNRP